jgi:hypothetical protein
MNETVETMAVAPRTPDRTPKMPPSRQYKAFPKHVMGGQETEPSTGPSSSTLHTTTNNSKASEDPVNLHYRQNFGKDGIYVPPLTAAMRLSKKHNITAINSDHDQNPNQNESGRIKYPRTRITATSTTRLDDGQSEIARSTAATATSFRGSAPQSVPLVAVADERVVENDVPFDQANDDDAARETVVAFRDGHDENHTRLRNCSDSYYDGTHPVESPGADAPTPLRNPKVSDFEDSCYSPGSTRFESIWLSTPEATPDRTGRITSRHANLNEQLQLKDGGAVVETVVLDELDDNVGRFTFPPPKLSDPNPADESLTRNPRLAVVSTCTQSHSKDRISSLPSEADRTTKTGKELAIHRIEPVKESPGGTNSIANRQDFHDKHNHSNDKTIISAIPTSDSCNEWVRKSYNQSEPGCAPTPGTVMPPSSGGVHCSTYDDVDSIFDSVLEQEDERVIQLGGDDEPDNLYKNVRVTHKVRRKTRQRRKLLHVQQQHPHQKATHDGDDDTSTENYGAGPVYATSLQERAHQAWKSRQQKKISSFRTKQDGGTKSKGTNVSFGAPNTVHHFQPEPPIPRAYDDEEDLTSLDRSLNSEYTKTLESEVEDMIKDILFIGNSKISRPGRRKIRHKPDIRRRIKQRSVPNTTVGKGDLGTLFENRIDSGDEDESDQPPVYEPRWVMKKDSRERKTNKSDPSNDSTYSTESTRSRSQSLSMGDDRSTASSRASSVDTNTVATFQSERDTSDPLNVVMGFVEGGLTAMSSAIGFAMGDDESRAYESRGRQQDRARGTSTGPVQSSMDGLNIFDTCTGRQHGINTIDNTAISDVMGMLAQDLWFGPSLGKSRSGSGQLRSMDSEGSYVIGNRTRSLDLGESRADDEEIAKRLLQLGSGSELSSLAVHAAHSVHKIQGVEFDESVSIDMYKDLKISSVQLKLPLGRESLFSIVFLFPAMFWMLTISFFVLIWHCKLLLQLFSWRMRVSYGSVEDRV